MKTKYFVYVVIAIFRQISADRQIPFVKGAMTFLKTCALKIAIKYPINFTKCAQTVVKPNDFQLLAVRVYNGVHIGARTKEQQFLLVMYIPELAEASIICRPCVCTYIM